MYSDAVAYADIVADIDVLPERTIGTDASTLLDVAEMPNFGSVTYLDIVVDVTTFVDKEIGHEGDFYGRELRN